MLANGKTMKWEGGSFRPNGPKIGRGNGGGRLAKNFTRWSSKDPILASRIFVGFNVGPEPVYTIDDLIEIVKNARWAQTGDPSSTFVAQRGVYRHEDGDVVEEDGAQVILFNTEEFSYESWVEQMIALAEAIAERMEQEEVIVEIQKGGVTQEVLGVGPGRMAANARPEGDILLEYGTVRLTRDQGWVPAVWELVGDAPARLLTNLSPPGSDREDALAGARVLAEREAAHYVGDWNVQLVEIEDMEQGEASERMREYHMRHRPNADWEATGRIAYRGRDSGGPGIETSLETRADGREGPRIDYKLTPNQLRSRSTQEGTKPLTGKQDAAAYEAGYEAASLFSTSRVPTDLDDIFIYVLLHDKRVPNITEDDPQFYEWRLMVQEGAGDYLESYPPPEPEREATRAFRKRYGLV